MQSTASTAAAPGGADPKASSAKVPGSAAAKKAQVSTSGFNSKEAERWMETRWKALQSSSDGKLDQKAEVYKAAPGTGGSAWGPNKKTANDRFCNELSKAATAAGL